jgi:hypothetical protein
MLYPPACISPLRTEDLPGRPAAVPEIIDTVFAKTSPKRSFSMTEYERCGLVFTKTRVYKFGHWCLLSKTGLEALCPNL